MLDFLVFAAVWSFCFFPLVLQRCPVVASSIVSSRRTTAPSSLLGNVRHAGSWEVINLATQSLTSAPSSRWTPQPHERNGRRGASATAEVGGLHRNRWTSADSLPHALILHRTHLSQSLATQTSQNISRESSTSWLFLFYCGGKHLLNYRCSPKRTLDLNPAGPYWIWEGGEEGREGGEKMSGDQYHVVGSVWEIIRRGCQLACCVSGMLASCNVTASTGTCHVSERSTNHFERPLEKCASVTP